MGTNVRGAHNEQGCIVCTDFTVHVLPWTKMPPSHVAHLWTVGHVLCERRSKQSLRSQLEWVSRGEH